MTVSRLHNFDIYKINVVNVYFCFKSLQLTILQNVGILLCFSQTGVDVATSSVRTQLMMMCLAE